MRRCPSCGEENPDRFRLCGFCGAALAQVVAAEVRKTVSIVFCDLKGSTDLGEHVDPEALRELLGRYFEIMRGVLEHHGGTVEKYIGDAIMAVFGVPRVHEDDALRAVRAAFEMREALARLNDEIERRWGVRLKNRTGVNTGEVVAGDVTLGQRLVTGDTVNVAARLEQAAPENDVLIGDTTYRLVREAVDVEAVEPLSLKGKSERVPAYRLVAVRPGVWFARRMQAQLVGRERELDVLSSAFSRARIRRHVEAVTVLGDAGLGKTRLLEEFVGRVAAEAVVLRGRCLSYGDGMTFWPIAEIVRQAGAITERDDVAAAHAKLVDVLGSGSVDVIDRLFAAIGLTSRSYPLQETFWAVRKLIELLGRNRTVVVIFDDIQWAERTLLDLIAHVVGMDGESPALVVCAARHELFDDHKDWLGSFANAAQIVLEPLGAEESVRVVENLLGNARIPLRLRDAVLAAADGVPLYVEQMLSMLVDDGVLVADSDGVWSVAGDVSRIVVPPTISALLAARLDRLHDEERVVLSTAAVAGVLFHEPAVQELVPDSIRDRVPVNTMVLAKKQLIRPDLTAYMDRDRAFRFTHVLIREAAYEQLLKRTRADLHERFAAWFARAIAGAAFEYEELIGYHLEQASQYLKQLGPLDAHGVELCSRAVERLSAVGAKALARGDMPAATNFMERAMALLPEADPRRLFLAADLAEAWRTMGQFAKARALVSEALGLAGETDARLSASLRLTQLLLDRSTQPDWAAVAEPRVRAAIAVFEEAGDHVGVIRAWRVLATIYGTQCRYAEAQEAAEHALESARRAEDVDQQRRTLAALAMCAVFGPQRVDDAIALCERMALQAAGDKRAEATVLVALAQLLAMRGEFDRARSLYRRGHATLTDLGGRLYAAAASLFAARVELLAGEANAAIALLRPDYEALAEMGERGHLPTAAALLAEASYAVSAYADADALAMVSERTASPTDVESQYRWRCVRARLLARDGRGTEAVALVREALRLVLATDAPAMQADVFAAMAAVLEMTSDHAAAKDARDRARDLYAKKSDVVSIVHLGGHTARASVA